MNIITFDTLESTNTYCKQNIDSLADKTIVSTLVQTAGRGRFERSWVGLGNENIYMSFVLKPSNQFFEVYSNLTQYLSVCLCKQLEGMGIFPQIKWPNDVLINGKKICGILAESVISHGILKGIVLGVGVNLNVQEQCLAEVGKPVTSLNIELGHSINKNEFMQKLIDNFFVGYDDFLEKGFVSIKEDYEKRANFINKNLKIIVFKTEKEGLVQGVDDEGCLILLNANGGVEKINMGEII